MAKMHELDRCVVTGWRIEKRDRVPLQPCPHCGTRLPMKGDSVPVEEEAARSQKILAVTTDAIAGYRIVKTLGVFRSSKGHNVRTEAAAAKNATLRIQQAVLGAGGNAIVGFRMAVSESLVYTYGTGVVIEKIED